MKYGTMIIEKKEYVLLKKLMNLSGYHKDETFRKSIKKFLEELESAKVVDEEETPNDVIRFNSVVTLSVKNGWRKELKLVLPTESNLEEGKISILTSMGTAIMGHAEGDSIVWEFTSGAQQLNIEKVIQEKRRINLDMVL